jgi:hypothetical protein
VNGEIALAAGHRWLVGGREADLDCLDALAPSNALEARSD